MRRLPPLAALRAFEAAARQMSFKRAAEELGVTPTAISHQIRLLEDALGLKLFHRGVRKVTLTQQGGRLFPVLSEGLDRWEAAIVELHHPRRRTITLSATTAFTARWLVPRVDAFREANPELDLRLHASEAIVDLRSGEADAAIRYGCGPFPGVVSEPLTRVSFAPVCSPSLGLMRPEQLAEMPLLHNEWHRLGPETPTWERWCILAGMEGVDCGRGVTFTAENHAIQAAVAGKGVALLSPLLLSAELEQGTLVQPFGPALAGASFHFVHLDDPDRNGDHQALRSWLEASLGG